jgi:hypothetical protein
MKPRLHLVRSEPHCPVPPAADLRLTGYAPIVRVAPTKQLAKRRAAVMKRQRRRQQHRKAGLKIFPLPLPEQKVIAAVRARENLGRPPTKKQILASLQLGALWLIETWIRAGKKPHA